VLAYKINYHLVCKAGQFKTETSRNKQIAASGIQRSDQALHARAFPRSAAEAFARSRGRIPLVLAIKMLHGYEKIRWEFIRL
jgi:hypothetical protein